MYKDGVLTIQEWQKGVAQSPWLGFQSVSNLEVFENPGIAKLAFRTTPYFTIDGLPVAYQKDIYGNEFVLTSPIGSAGKLYKNGVVLQTGLNNAWDLVIYKDYLIVSYNGVLGAYGPLSSAGAVFFPNWKTGLSASFYGKMLVGQDDIVYIGNANNVASLSSLVVGAIGVAPTATLNTSALDLPEGQYVVTFAELGRNLMIGTQGGSNWPDRINYRVANIYPWDRTSSTFNLPVQMQEDSIQQLLSHNNRLIVVAGVEGNIYDCDGTNYRRIGRIPWSYNRTFNTQVKYYPNAISINHSGNLIIGTSTTGDPYQDTINPIKHGVYEMNLSSGKYEIVFKHQISSGDTGVNQPLYIGFVIQTAQDTLLLGWQDGASYGIDTTDFRRYTSYVGYIESPLFYIAPRVFRKTFQQLEFMLAYPLTTGQSVRISYRKNLSLTYTVIGTYDFATLGSVISHNAKALLADIEIIQFKIELTQPLTADAIANLQLLNVRVW